MNVLQMKEIDKLDAFGDYRQKCGVARDNLYKIIKANKMEYKRVIIRVVCDYIAGMTDDYAIAQFNKLYGSNNIKSN